MQWNSTCLFRDICYIKTPVPKYGCRLDSTVITSLLNQTHSVVDIVEFSSGETSIFIYSGFPSVYGGIVASRLIILEKQIVYNYMW